MGQILSRFGKNPEILEGLFRPGDLITLSGFMNVGKSPLVREWAIIISSGLSWCGRKSYVTPVILIDFETRGEFFFDGIGISGGWYSMCERYGINPASLDVEFYLDHDTPSSKPSQELHTALGRSVGDKFDWLSSKLAKKPNALVIIDPLQLLFNFDKNRGQQVIFIYSSFRNIQRHFPLATFLFTFNLKKRDRRVEVPSLLRNPQDWLQECAGNLDLQNRSDSRLGLDTLTPEDREPIIFNGFRRGEPCDPLVLEPFWYTDRMAGFRKISHTLLDLKQVLSPQMIKVWNSLDEQFTSFDVHNHESRSTAYRLKNRAVSLGLVEEVEPGVFKKAIVG